SSARCRAACPRNCLASSRTKAWAPASRRSIGRPEVARLDPFLLLDEFRGSAPAGFPDHPHRGFETVTYVLEGAVRTRGLPWQPGRHQARRPAVDDGRQGHCGHCEMPHGEVECAACSSGLNLPRTDKMTFAPPTFPSRQSGRRHCPRHRRRVTGAKSPVFTRHPTLYLDVTVQPGEFTQPVPAGLERIHIRAERPGRVRQQRAGAVIGEAARDLLLRPLRPGRLRVAPVTGAAAACRFVLIAGRPLGEPVEAVGPFVMCSKAELLQAKEDYRNGRNGFERAPGWASFVVREQAD
uniref:Pirin_C domain-containing protein n=1 Tax=Macrostomum lignano TaxID=282301 RepID=A0A1I8F1V3_9PLAT